MSIVLILVVFAVVFFAVRTAVARSARGAVASAVARPNVRLRFEAAARDVDDADDDDAGGTIVAPPGSLAFTLPPGALDALPAAMRENVAAALAARASAAVAAAVPVAAGAGLAALRVRAAAALSQARVGKQIHDFADMRSRTDGTVPPAPVLAPLSALAVREPVPALRRQPPLEALAVTTARSHAWRS